MDVYFPALLRSARLTIGIATTKEACATAQAAHELTSSSAIALGRMLTAAALFGLIQERRGGLSLQVSANGRIGNIFADVTNLGHLRGYVRNPSLALPLFPGETLGGRRSVAAGIGQGNLSVIHLPEGAEFTHSTTEIVTGEIDTDVENFLNVSEQIPTVLACDVLLNDKGKVELAGGIIIQAMPDADLDRLKTLRNDIHNGGFAKLLREHAANPTAILKALVPDADPIESKREIRWQCRCSEERVVAALHALDTLELADMVQKAETVELNCDFCATRYAVAPSKIEEIYSSRLQTLS